MGTGCKRNQVASPLTLKVYKAVDLDQTSPHAALRLLLNTLDCPEN